MIPLLAGAFDQIIKNAEADKAANQSVIEPYLPYIVGAIVFLALTVGISAMISALKKKS